MYKKYKISRKKAQKIILEAYNLTTVRTTSCKKLFLKILQNCWALLKNCNIWEKKITQKIFSKILKYSASALR